MKVVINPDFIAFKDFLDSLPELFDKKGKSIYKARNEIKVFEIHGMLLNVKSYKKPIFLNRIAYTFFRKSKACRAYENALRVLSLGIDTPAPVCYIEIYSGGLLERSFFISVHCLYTRNFREFANNSDLAGREAIPEALGHYVARMHKAGILHKDLSIGNILFEADSDKVDFSLVDLNRMDFCKVDKKTGCRNFERLRGNSDFFRLLSNAYSEDMGYDQKRCLETIMKFNEKSVRFFRRKSERKKRLRAAKTGQRK